MSRGAPPPNPYPDGPPRGIPAMPNSGVPSLPLLLGLLTATPASPVGAPTQTDPTPQASPPENRAVVSPTGAVWVWAPASSHVSRMCYIDNRVKKTDRHSIQRPHELHVVFKGPNYQGESAQYMYLYRDYDEGAELFDALCRSNHPFSQILKPHVIDAGVAHERVS